MSSLDDTVEEINWKVGQGQAEGHHHDKRVGGPDIWRKLKEIWFVQHREKMSQGQSNDSLSMLYS